MPTNARAEVHELPHEWRRLEPKRLLWIALAVLAVVTVAGAAFLLARPDGPELNGTSLNDPPSVRNIALASTAGETVRLGDWQGDLMVVFFGYANCPDVCPLTMASLAGAYRDLGEPDGLQVIMVTVDPERDTPEVLQRYVESFHPDFVGLTGTPQQIADASSRFYATAVEQLDGLVSHNSHVTLVDPDGRMRVVYNQDKVDGLLQEDLEELLARNGEW